MTQLLSVDQIDLASELLRKGELVAFPTETVYGLGALISHPEAVARIFAVKGRPQDNPLIVHVAKIDEVLALGDEIPESFFQLAEAFWPGPLTLILKKHPHAPTSVCAGLSTIAMRMPSHPVARELIERVGPIAAPSANLSGKPSSTSARHVLDDFEGKIAAILDGGESACGIESTVISLAHGENPVLLRPGVIEREALEKALGKKLGTAQTSDAKASPGTRYRHYAPKAPIYLFANEEELQLFLAQAAPKKRMLLVSRSLAVPIEQFMLSRKTLYALLRKSDREGYEEIMILLDPTVQRDEGLMNRITHALGNTYIGT